MESALSIGFSLYEPVIICPNSGSKKMEDVKYGIKLSKAFTNRKE